MWRIRTEITCALVFWTPRIRIECSLFCGQLPTTMSTPKVQMCVKHQHALAGDCSHVTAARSPDIPASFYAGMWRLRTEVTCASVFLLHGYALNARFSARAAEIPTSFYAGTWRFRTDITCASVFVLRGHALNARISVGSSPLPRPCPLRKCKCA
jgi:hypothetical protein